MPLAPTNIQLIGQELAVSWNDGTENYFNLERLRRACPCAACGGEPDVLGHIVRPNVAFTEASFQLKAFNIIGGYAVQPRWADGHDTGLYSFSYLKRLNG
jgi:DUF971 family protein